MTPAQGEVSAEFLKHRDALRSYAMRLTRDGDRANDLLQDVYLRAMDNAHMFKPGTNCRAWLFILTRNKFMDGTRAAKRRGVPVTLDDIAIPYLPPRQEDNLRRDHLMRLLKLLPADTRLILLMAGIDGMKYDEIAEVMGCEVGTVKSKISRARDLLGRAL